MNSAQLVELWDSLELLPPGHRGLQLLAVIYPNAKFKQLKSLTLSQRDAALLWFRQQLFDSQLFSVANCPQCQELIELSFSAEDVGLGEAQMASPDQVNSSLAKVELGDQSLQIRAVTVGDLLLCEREQGIDRQLLAKLTLQQEWHGVLTEQQLQQIEQSLEKLDPQAAPEVSLNCPGCEHQWVCLFDALQFFCKELQSAITGLLWQVAQLARVYHWSEREILAMTDSRRSYYLELI